ncbi:MAG: tyrosine--tRNA ligase [Lachnospiraceae bacterium]|nr:tyrosine--tRNA ligase [Lachnospiraceae bacterium]
MQVFEELKERGLLAQLTDEKEIRDLINRGGATFYIGFDPTADSLHVGHFMALCLMKRLQMAGNKPIALVGGGTGMIGDPTGRSDLRQVLTVETIQHNCDCFRKQMSRFIDFSDSGKPSDDSANKAIMVNNADWLLDLNYMEFIRDIGPCFSVNNMLRAECYKQRMEKGLTFLEFNYMLLQSYDFLMLYEKYGCQMQFGGDDQWSNMLGGTELIRKKLGKDAYAMTITLLLNSEGKKMGKTAKGAVWLDADKTTPYEFYQYWRNVDDADVMKCLNMLTFLPIEQIKEMENWDDTRINEKKEILAFELTKLVHGEDEANKAQSGAKALFAGGGDSSLIPVAELKDGDFRDGSIDIMGVLVAAGLNSTRSDARRAVEQGGVTFGEEKVTDIKTCYNKETFKGDGVIVRRGKKNFKRVVCAED